MSAPAFQFYPKQWLGDDKVLAMDWNARAMHMHLMCIAWQQHPPCTLPDDDAMIRRWLGNPRGWDVLKTQIFSAWVKEEGRWLQHGLLRQYNKQSAYSESRKEGAKARWNKDACASDMQCTNDALLSSSSSSDCINTIKPSAFVDSWNRLCGPLPKIIKLTPGLKHKISARVKCGLTIERFEEAIAACLSKPFLRGDNERGWVATFHWLMANSENVEKAVANPYGSNGGNGHAKLDKFAQMRKDDDELFGPAPDSRGVN